MPLKFNSRTITVKFSSVTRSYECDKEATELKAKALELLAGGFNTVEHEMPLDMYHGMQREFDSLLDKVMFAIKNEKIGRQIKFYIKTGRGRNPKNYYFSEDAEGRKVQYPTKLAYEKARNEIERSG